MVDVYIPEQEEDTNLTQQYHDYAKAGTLMFLKYLMKHCIITQQTLWAD